MSWPNFFATFETGLGLIALLAYVIFIVLIATRILITTRTVGTTLAWLLLIFILPLVGCALYLLLGEPFIGRYRQQRAQKSFQNLISNIHSFKAPLSTLGIDPDDPAKPIWDQSYGAIKIPAYRGNHAEAISDSTQILESILANIRSAERSVFMEFYICHEGGLVDEILNELMLAQKRQVLVTLILDSLGSRTFLNGVKARELRACGINIVEALHTSPFRLSLRRRDLRMHRKLLVFDSQTAYTGSMNLADPSVFNVSAGVGQWIDMMVKIHGPVVPSMESVFINDWMMEQRLENLETNTFLPLPHKDGIPIQVVPSGPALANENLIYLFLTAIYSARSSIDITTPYFVPDDAILLSLKAAAQRGVAVSIYLPFNNNSWLAKHAGRSFYEELLEMGVRICPFRDGLLHTKCVLIDKQVALLGSVNLDMRSLWLNFEITIVVSDGGFCQKIDQVIEQYNKASDTLDLSRWKRRSILRKILERGTRLLSPLL